MKLNVNQSIVEAPRRVPIGADGITVEDEASLWIDYCIYIGSHKSGIMLCMGFPFIQGAFLCPRIVCCSNLPKFHRQPEQSCGDSVQLRSTDIPGRSARIGINGASKLSNSEFFVGSGFEKK